MYIANDEQKHLAKCIKEFKTNTKPQHDSNLKKVNEEVLNSALTLLKGRETLFKAFENRIFSRLEQSEQPKQSTSNDKCTSLKLRNNLSTSNNASHISFSSDSDTPLFTLKKGTGLKILTSKQMLQMLPMVLAQVKAGNN